jgi:ATP-dependent DNA ligase
VVREIKFDGYWMAARIEKVNAHLLTPNWRAKYPATAAVFATLKVTTAHIDGELCGASALTASRRSWPARERLA